MKQTGSPKGQHCALGVKRGLHIWQERRSVNLAAGSAVACALVQTAQPNGDQSAGGGGFSGPSARLHFHGPPQMHDTPGCVSSVRGVVAECSFAWCRRCKWTRATFLYQTVGSRQNHMSQFVFHAISVRPLARLGRRATLRVFQEDRKSTCGCMSR